MPSCRCTSRARRALTRGVSPENGTRCVEFQFSFIPQLVLIVPLRTRFFADSSEGYNATRMATFQGYSRPTLLGDARVVKAEIQNVILYPLSEL